VNSSTSFLFLAAASSVLLLGVLTASIIVGSVRRKAGHLLSDEIEQAAGMQGRWRSRPARPEPPIAPGGNGAGAAAGKGDHAAA
jgi:hypothetical protein